MEAENACEIMGGHLAVINSVDEYEEIMKVIRTHDINKDYLWLGGELDTASSYRWITDEPMGYTRWASGQPDFVSR